MNKSDIMKVAVSKVQIIERANQAKDWICGNAEVPIEMQRYFLEALVCAAELLKQVEVLPEGSEPLVGDIVRILTPNYRDCFYYGEVTQINDKALRIANNRFSAMTDFYISDCAIIQRKGKPVIIEKEGV